MFHLKFHWSLLLRVQLSISQDRFGSWLDAWQMTSHYLNQCWPRCLPLYDIKGHNEFVSLKLLYSRPDHGYYHNNCMGFYTTSILQFQWCIVPYTIFSSIHNHHMMATSYSLMEIYAVNVACHVSVHIVGGGLMSVYGLLVIKYFFC